MATTNLTVDYIAPSGGGYEPQRRNQYYIQFILNDSGDEKLLKLSTIGAFIPEMTNDEVEFPGKNTSVYVAGRATYSEGTVRVRDFIDTDTAGVVYRWKKKVYNPFNDKIGLASDYKVTAYIYMLSPNDDDNFKRTWRLEGCWPKTVTAGDLDNTSNDQVELEITIRYDKAFPTFAYQQ